MPKRRANIYKRKDGRWEARYVSSVGIDGKKKYTSVYASTYREVKEKQAEGMKSASAPTKRNGSLTIEDVMMMWLATTVNTTLRRTCSEYEEMHSLLSTAEKNAEIAKYYDALAAACIRRSPAAAGAVVNGSSAVTAAAV